LISSQATHFPELTLNPDLHPVHAVAADPEQAAHEVSHGVQTVFPSLVSLKVKLLNGQPKGRGRPTRRSAMILIFFDY